MGNGILSKLGERIPVVRMFTHKENPLEAIGNSVKKVAGDVEQAGEAVVNRSPVGRIIFNGESVGEAFVNTGKQAVEDFGIFADRAPVGRMIKNGEGPVDAFVNAGKQIVEDITGK